MKKDSLWLLFAAVCALTAYICAMILVGRAR